MRAALLQMTGSDDPAENVATLRRMLAEAAQAGADLACTPEVANVVSRDRRWQERILRPEARDPALAALRQAAAEHRLWIAVGSLALRAEGGEGAPFVNRSFVISPDGEIVARYDKIHMFDVSLGAGEIYRESAAFRPGRQAVVVEAAGARLGLSICYDLRFPRLYRDLAQAGAQLLLVPAAFSPVTGAAHWEVLLRARAIENGAFVLAAAQTGTHPARHGPPRRSWGHSMAVDPWGEVLCDAGPAPGVQLVELDLARVAEVRQRIPALLHDRAYNSPR